MYKIALPFCSALLALAPAAFASEKNQHFPALPAPDVATALCNIASYNQKLAAITSKPEISSADMVKVHELTYTLENALQRLDKSLKLAAEELEKVHLASESLEQGAIKASGELYLQETTSLLQKPGCP